LLKWSLKLELVLPAECLCKQGAWDPCLLNWPGCSHKAKPWATDPNHRASQQLGKYCS